MKYSPARSFSQKSSGCRLRARRATRAESLVSRGVSRPEASNKAVCGEKESASGPSAIRSSSERSLRPMAARIRFRTASSSASSATASRRLEREAGSTWYQSSRAATRFRRMRRANQRGRIGRIERGDVNPVVAECLRVALGPGRSVDVWPRKGVVDVGVRDPRRRVTGVLQQFEHCPISVSGRGFLPDDAEYILGTFPQAGGRSSRLERPSACLAKYRTDRHRSATSFRCSGSSTGALSASLKWESIWPSARLTCASVRPRSRSLSSASQPPPASSIMPRTARAAVRAPRLSLLHHFCLRFSLPLFRLEGTLLLGPAAGLGLRGEPPGGLQLVGFPLPLSRETCSEKLQLQRIEVVAMGLGPLVGDSQAGPSKR